MGQVTAIEWTATRLPDGTMRPGATFNAWIGCTRVSDGCRFCYAEAQDRHRSWTPEGWGKGKPRKRTSAAYWKQPIAWNREAEKSGIRRKVFCASLSDVFDEEVSHEWRADLFEVIQATPHLDWLLLTKRPHNISDMLACASVELCDRQRAAGEGRTPTIEMLCQWNLNYNPPTNVWLGTTVEDGRVLKRIDYLLEIPAVVHFLSIEPMIGRVVLPQKFLDLGSSGWAIFGGESGPGHRELNMIDLCLGVDQCRQSGNRVFLKQDSGPKSGQQGRIPDELWALKQFPVPQLPLMARQSELLEASR